MALNVSLKTADNRELENEERSRSFSNAYCAELFSKHNFTNRNLTVSEANCIRYPLLYIDRSQNFIGITTIWKARKRAIDSTASRYFYIPKVQIKINVNAIAVKVASNNRAFKNRSDGEYVLKLL